MADRQLRNSSRAYPLLGIVFTLLLISDQVCRAAENHRELSDEIEKDIYALMDTYRVSGLAVSIVKDQDVLLSRGFGIESGGKRLPITRTTQMEMFSATKMLTALTILSLVEKEKLDVNSPLGSMLDNIPESWKPIPFWRLLNHTSGITTVIDKPEFDTLTEVGNASDKNIVDIVKAYPLDYPPGRYSRYRQSGYAIAAKILSDRLNMDWPEIVDKQVLAPATIEQTDHWEVAYNNRENPILAAGSGYLTTPEDMTKLFRTLNAGKIVSPETIKKELLDQQRMVENYSLGVIVENYGDEVTIGHEGGGARANIRYAPDKKVGVALFTDQEDNYEITIELAGKVMKRLLMNLPMEKSRQPIAIRLADYRDQPAEKIIAFYTNAKARHRDQYNFARAEAAINSLGYYLLGIGETDRAIAIFKFNTTEFPQSANTYDSLGEAWLEKGNVGKAVENYRKSLTLDPENQHAVEILKKIEGKVAINE